MAAGDFIPEVWAGDLLKNWDEQFAMLDVVNRQFEGEISGFGDTVHALNLGDITVNTYAGTIASYEAIPESTDSMLINQQRYWAFKIGDVQKIQSKPELRGNYTRRAAIALKRNVERFELGSTIYAAAGNVYKSKTTAGDGAKIETTNVYDTLVELRQLCEDDNTWVEGSMWLTLPPVIMKKIRLSGDLIKATETSEKFLRDGKCTKLADWNLLPISAGNLTGSGTDGAPYHMLAGNRDAIHFAEQVSKTRAMDLENSFDLGVSGLMVFGTKVFAQNANCLVDWQVEVGTG